MLILAYADRLGIDLYQLCKRILQSSCNGGCTSLSHIKVGKLFCCQFACRIDGCPRLVHDHILNRCIKLLDQLHDHLFRFSGGSAVSYTDERNTVLLNQLLQFCLGFLHLVLWCRRIDHLGIQHLSCGIYHCQLAACTEGRVPAEYHLPGNWRLHEKLLQVLTEHTDSSVLCLFRELTSDLTFNGRRDQSVIGIPDYLQKNRCCIFIVRRNNLLSQILQNSFFRSNYLHHKEFFVFTSVQRKDTMAECLFHRLLVGIVHLIYALCLFILSRTGEHALFHGDLPDVHAVICLIGNHFRNNILGTLKCFLLVLNFLLLTDILSGLRFKRLVCILLQDIFGKAIKPLFLGNTGPGLSLRSVWSVKILHHHKCLCGKDFLLQFLRQFPLLFYTSDYLLLLFLQIAQIIQSLI